MHKYKLSIKSKTWIGRSEAEFIAFCLGFLSAVSLNCHQRQRFLKKGPLWPWNLDPKNAFAVNALRRVEVLQIEEK